MSKDPAATHLHEQAIAFMNRGQYGQAIDCFQQALFIQPDYASAYNNRANCLKTLGNAFDAVLNYDRALQLEPAIAEYHSNRGAALMDLGQIEAAIASYRTAIAIRPNLDVAYRNLGNAMRAKGLIPEASVLYRKALEITPENADAHLALSLALLEMGKYKEGWKEYEWRFKSQLPSRGLPFPEWHGKKIGKDKAVLIYSEQGHGDTLQFCRYAEIVKKRCGGTVYIECRQPLVRLIKTVSGCDGVIPFGDPIPKNVTHCIAMLSIPRVVGTTVKNIPNKVPYLFVNHERSDMWTKDLALLPPGMKIGICWAGMSRPSQPNAQLIDERRSTALKQFAPLAEVKGVSWVSLQLGPPLAQIQEPPPGMKILDVAEQLDDFYDTASLIARLDLVITVDTAVCHVAGALGVPTWMLSRFDGCWRWLGPRSDSPWYPTLRQYRQPKSGDWYSVMKAAAEDLYKLAGNLKQVA